MKRARVVQIAISARQPRQLAEFYNRVFGWEGSAFRNSFSEVFVIEEVGTEIKALIETPQSFDAGVSGFVCTVAVESIAQTRDLLVAHGARVIREIPFIDGVGGYVRFADPEGNVVTAMQFE